MKTAIQKISICIVLAFNLVWAAPMELVFNTTLGEGTTVSLPLLGTVNVNVDWGDGNSNCYTSSGEKSHSYASDGIYTVQISGSLTHFGNYCKRPFLTSVVSFGDLGIENLNAGFYYAENLTSVPAVLPSSVTDLSYLFYCNSSMNCANVSSWDVSNIQDMRYLFYKTSVFNQDISGWNVANVTNMSDIFARSTAFNQDISGWNVNNVTNMSEMFGWAEEFNQDISGWDISRVTDMSGMFTCAYRFNQDISNWHVDNVENMSSMFANTADFNQNLNGWNVSNVTDMSGMFALCYYYNPNLNNWDVSNVKNMEAMFEGCIRFNQDISSWKVGSVQSMSRMFRNAQIFNCDISGWNLSKVTDISQMFNMADIFNQPIGNWNVSNVTDMSYAFRNTENFNQDISSWDVSSVSDMSNMFIGAESFNENNINYPALLHSWSNLTLQEDVTLDCANGLCTYSSADVASRAVLTDNYNWTINDDGPAADEIPLSIALSGFSAEYKNGCIDLSWETATETNNAKFILYRDGEIRAELQGAGTSSDTNTYSFCDDEVISGNIYTYSLADMDLANVETLRKSITVTAGTRDLLTVNGFAMDRAYPNPFNPMTTVPFVLNKDMQVKIIVCNMSGSAVQTENRGSLGAGSYHFTLNGNSLSSGIYFVSILADEKIHTQKIVLMK